MSAYEKRWCEKCDEETEQEFEAGNNGGYHDEPASVDCYTCNECQASYVWSTWDEEFIYDPPVPNWR